MQKNNFKIFFHILFSLFLISCSSCKNEISEIKNTGETIKILNWNCQTFFDAENDGNEYSEFTKSKTWNLESYSKRLENLCLVIKQSKADIIVLEELEKESQIQDIKNILSGTFDFSNQYNYGCFARNPDSSIGTALLSRKKIVDFSLHNIDYKNIKSKNREENNKKLIQPSMRPLLEATILSGKEENISVKIFANHWKSKSSGEKESEIWRTLQENLLSEKILQSYKNGFYNIIACGDFNKEYSEFKKPLTSNSGNILLGENSICVTNPWENLENFSSSGSYRYNGKWEKIDHFFLYGKTAVKKFLPMTNGPWCSEEGFPISFKINTLSGFSDHLPIFGEFYLFY